MCMQSPTHHFISHQGVSPLPLTEDPHASGTAEEIPTSRAMNAPTSSSCLPPRPWDSGPRRRNPALVTKTPHLNAGEYPATEAQPT